MTRKFSDSPSVQAAIEKAASDLKADDLVITGHTIYLRSEPIDNRYKQYFVVHLDKVYKLAIAYRNMNLAEKFWLSIQNLLRGNA